MLHFLCAWRCAICFTYTPSMLVCNLISPLTTWNVFPQILQPLFAWCTRKTLRRSNSNKTQCRIGIIPNWRPLFQFYWEVKFINNSIGLTESNVCFTHDKGLFLGMEHTFDSQKPANIYRAIRQLKLLAALKKGDVSLICSTFNRRINFSQCPKSLPWSELINFLLFALLIHTSFWHPYITFVYACITKAFTSIA